jgi:PAS domain S-box-containing protein
MVDGGTLQRADDAAPGPPAAPRIGRDGAPFRRYSLIVAASIIPLAIAIVALTGYQLLQQRGQLLEELQNEAIGQDVLLASVTKTVRDHVRALATWAEIYRAERAGDAPGAASRGRTTAGDAVLGGAPPADLADAGAELAVAERLVPHMRLGHEAMPYLRRSYYVSGAHEFLQVYPMQNGVAGAPSEELVDLAFGRDFFPDGEFWTRAFRDPEGTGWAVAHAVPVGDGSAGIVASTVPLDFLSSFLRAFDYPSGHLWLVNRHDQVLAASDGPVLAGVQLKNLEAVLPAALRELPRDVLLQPSTVFRRIGAQYVLARPVVATPWTMLFTISSAELNQVLLPRFIPYGIILLALILTLLLTHVLRQRLYVRPALGLADYIRAESLDQHPDQPRLPALWRPWLRAVADAFAAKRSALARIADSEALKAATIDNALDGLITIDEQSTIIEFNPAAERLFGIERSAALGRSMPELIIPPHMREVHRQGMRRYLRTGEPHVVGQRVEVEAIRADGQPFPIELAISEVYQAGRRLFTAYVRDITEHRRMERVLRESEQYFKTLAEAHPVAICIVRLEDRKMMHASQAFADLFGVPLADLPGVDVRRFYVDLRDRDRLVALLRAHGAVDGFELMQRRADGTVFPTVLSSRLMEFQGQRAIVSGVLDLTRQKQAEAEIAHQREALRASEQRFRTIAEAHPVPVCIMRRSDRRIVYASQRFADLVGMSLGQVRGIDYWSLHPQPEDRERLALALRRDGAIGDQEAIIRRADGSTFPAAITAHAIEYEGEEAAIFGVMDLSAQKQAESEIARQREALHQSEKLSALGSLLAGVAHELNNPLSVVVGYAALLRASSNDPKNRDRAERIHAAANRCSRIVKSYLALARKKPAARTAVQINELIEAALEFASYGLRTRDVEIVRDLEADLPTLLADGDQLVQVFMNLIVNAQHALQQVPPPRRLRIVSRREPGGVRIEVADNGPGIPPEIASRIFEPFFTTKPQGVGTGIGLSVSAGIVAGHGGEIEVGPSPGGGAVFTIRLPAASAETERPAEVEPAAPRARTGRIMVVEDEEEIGEMLADTLRRDGHTTLVATSGRDALAQLDEHDVDMIISDLRMPDMDGPALYRELSRLRPTLAARTLFVTGDTLAADVTEFLSDTEASVIEKPIEPAEVRRRVQDLLARPPGDRGPASGPE